MNETHTTQPFGPFFPLIFTVAKWICRLLHPVTVQGLENLPRHGALLVANHASNWDPLVLATALPMDYRLCVMGKEELFRKIWDMDSVGDIATVTVHIKKIREKIEVNSAKPQYIETIWGVGYRFKV